MNEIPETQAMPHSRIPQVVLWLYLLSALLLTGGGLFEHMVLTPLWAGSPPDSVTAWPYGGIQRRFFILFSPTYYLLSLALIVGSWWMPRRQRAWAAIAGVSGLIIAVATFSFFIPILQKTQVTRGAGLSGAEITELIDRFKTANVGRYFVLIGGVLAGLYAIARSPQGMARGFGVYNAIERSPEVDRSLRGREHEHSQA